MASISAAVEVESSLDELDPILAQHPFGNSQYVTARLHACYKRRLVTLAARLPAAGKLLEAIERADHPRQYRVIGDTVVRCAIQHAQVQVESNEPHGLPLPQCQAIFEESARLLDDGGTGPLVSKLADRLGTDPHLGWVWSERRDDDLFTRAFHAIIRRNYDDAEPCTPSAGDLAMLQKGVRLLGELLPETSRSALSHTHLVVVYPDEGAWATRMSSSEFRISGTIFLSRSVLYNAWTVAEHLLHESLHQQLYDIRAGHTLLSPDSGRPDAPLIHSPWNKPDATRGNYWDVHRALAAFHVYVHLALLAILAERREQELREYGPLRMVGKRTALARAHYLLEQLRGPGQGELGLAGKRLRDWFASILELLDASPPAPGAYVHLLLDRYWREAMEVDALLRRAQPPALLSRLPQLVEEEVAQTRSVLSAVKGDVSEFDRALESFAAEDPANRFRSIRTLVAQTLLGSCTDGFLLSESMEPDAMVKNMVEGSSEVLSTLLEA